MLRPFDASLVPGADVAPYPTEAPTELRPWLLALALGLFLLDALAVLWLNGALALRPPPPAADRGVALVAAVALGVALSARPRPRRRGERPVRPRRRRRRPTSPMSITGNAEIDEASRAGLYGLSQVLAERTALEPGDPIGVDPGARRAGLLPAASTGRSTRQPAARSPATMARVDAYMRQGGSVLFDTRDQLERSTNINTFTGTPAVERLREMLSSLDIPPLEPVPADHVLTKAFYLLTDFPGRYAGGPLWVEATQTSDERADRPARAGDGVSSILITENDFAAAWAMDENGTLPLPDRAGRSAPARDGLPLRRQHRDVHADRQLQGRPGARAGAAREARAVA